MNLWLSIVLISFVIVYKVFNEGIATSNKIIIGIKLQNISITCLWIKFLLIIIDLNIL